MSFTFAVMADSHFHPADGPAEATHGSDAWFNERNAAVVSWLRQVDPAFVVHLGDLVHPIPGRPAHEPALDAAQACLGALGCPVHVVPGNHDVGDKPQPWAPAPRVTAAHHARFQARFNPPWWCFVRDGLRLVGVDTPVLGSGLPLEQQQWDWLEAELAQPGPKVVFQHYPPFLLEPGEAEHYDNLAPEVRVRLLELYARSEVVALFCGHVHHPFWHSSRGTDHYLLPATSFVRPGFSELSPVPPSGEHGRDDRHRLGLCLVHVDDGEIEVEWVWSEGKTGSLPPPRPRPRTRLGVTLRHAWDQVHTVPADNLDPYRRKRARDDLALLRAWSAGVRRLRLPLEDLERPATRDRLADLARHGFRFVFFHVGALTGAQQQVLAEHAGLVEALEWVRPRALLDEPASAPVPVWTAPHGAPAHSERFTHFVGHGYRLDDPDAHRGGGAGAVVRVLPDDLDGAVASARAVAGTRQPVLLLALPDAGEDQRATDDDAVARLVSAAHALAEAHPDVVVLLDTFVDHDRGYFPRNGLIDRAGRPRAGWYALRG